MHPFVVEEIACGTVRDRGSILELLQDLPRAAVAEAEEVLEYIERSVLDGTEIGYVDIHLLASVALTAGTVLWTRDKRLRLAAADLGCAFRDASAH